MFIKRVDILSEGPKISIFNQMYNKTLFGGTLSLIFIIIFLLISLAYLADYIMNDKYHIEYMINQEGLPYMEQYDPTLDFQINLLNTDNLSLSDRFCIYDLRRDRFLDLNEKFSSKVSDIRLGIFYICENESCLLNEDDESYLGYTALIRYQGYTFDHQGNIPLYKSDDIEYNSNNFVFFQKPLFEFMEWGIIKYYEKKYFLSVLSYIFGNEGEELIGGYIKNRDYFFADGILDPDDEMIYDNGTIYKLLSFIYMDIDLNQYEEYRRTKIGILDVLSNVFALSITIFNTFVYVFCNYYLINFDNYKIIEKILSKERRIKKYFHKDISTDKNDDRNKQIESIDNIDKADYLLDKDDNLETKDIIDEKKDYEIENEDRNIPKLRFIDFLINNIYCQKCCNVSNRQQIISSCNNLVSKYYTIEDIIYNQMKLENLLKDYKWNDPNLKYIENNEFIVQLKSYYNI